MSMETTKTFSTPLALRSNGKHTIPTSSSSTSARTSFSASSTPYRLQGSIPPSPDLSQSSAFPDESTIGILELPASPMIPLPVSPAIGEAHLQHKPPGLIRRISRGAQNRLRARASTSNLRKRDASSGPTVLRQRSESKTFTDGSFEPSDLDLDDFEPTGLDSPNQRMFEDAAPTSSPIFRHRRKYLGPGGDLLVPSLLLEGTQFTKITRKKSHTLLLRLDCDGNNKIFWSHAGSSSKRQIFIDDIKEIRTDVDVHNYLDEFDQPASTLSRWMTIIYTDSERGKVGTPKVKHLIAPDTASCRQWTSFLRFLMMYRGELMVGMGNNDEISQQQFWDSMISKRLQSPDFKSEQDLTVDFEKLKQSCHGFAIFKSDKDLREQWNQVDTQQTGRLNQAQAKELFKSIKYRQDIADVFEKIKPRPSCTKLSITDFFHFLQRYQGVDPMQDKDRWLSIFERFATAKDGIKTPASSDGTHSQPLWMDLEAFQEFLISVEHNPALHRSSDAPKLDRPFNEYFISSSHNTYLLGRQIGGESNAEGYTIALKQGCRCVEIDCWDGDDGKPKVTHGNTFTTRINFQECIKTISKHAFDASPYPLIISLEVHCNPLQQKVMVEIMKEHFGSKLLLAPLAGSETSKLPSPEQLKGKILIKVKKPQPDEPPASRHRRQRSKSEASTASTRHAPPPLPLTTTVPSSPQLGKQSVDSPFFQPASTTRVNTPGSSSDEEELEIVAVNAKRGKVRTSKIVPELGKLGVYVRGIKFAGFRASESLEYNHIFSFTESTFEDRCKTPELKHLMEEHNSKYLMRIYPKGSRLNSSNPNPLQFWRRGVQMVATNWQTPDVGTQINNAMFAAGHDCTGFVLKPQEMRRANDLLGFDHDRRAVRRKVQFSVDIISANRLESPPSLAQGAAINPYVEIEIFSADDKAKGLATAEGGKDVSHPNGTSGLNLPKRCRTAIKMHNGFNPQFNEPIKVALETKYSSLVFVRLTIWHSPDGHNPSTIKDPIGIFTAKLDSLNQGYRQLRLRNKQQEPIISTLFLYIHKEVNQDLHTEVAAFSDGLGEAKAVDENGRGAKNVLRRFLNRTPSGRRKPRENDGEYFFSRATSMEK